MSVKVVFPTGEAKKFHLSDNMTVEQLRETLVNETRRTTGFMCVRADDVRLILAGKTLENPTQLSECRILPSSVIHLALKVHGG